MPLELRLRAKGILTVIAMAITALALASPASAAPPKKGEAFNMNQFERVSFGYIGFAMVGPRGTCSSNRGAVNCTSVAKSYHRFWTHNGKSWRSAGTLGNQSDRAFYTAPYGNGWQWIWSSSTGIAVIPARALVRPTGGQTHPPF